MRILNVSSNVTAIASHASVVYILSLMMLYWVLKLVGFTVKKEAGKFVETWVESGEDLRSFEKLRARAQESKKGQKRAQKFFKILIFENLETFRNSLVPTLMLVFFIAYLWRQNVAAECDVKWTWWRLTLEWGREESDVWWWEVVYSYAIGCYKDLSDWSV